MLQLEEENRIKAERAEQEVLRRKAEIEQRDAERKAYLEEQQRIRQQENEAKRLEKE